MSIIKTKVYLHSSKSEMAGRGEEMELDEIALENFVYALYEVEFTLEVDTKTGFYKITHVNGKKLED